MSQIPKQETATAERIIVLLCLLWVGAAAYIFVTYRPTGFWDDATDLNKIALCVGVALPVLLMAMIAAMLRSARILRTEMRALRSTVSAMRPLDGDDVARRQVASPTAIFGPAPARVKINAPDRVQSVTMAPAQFSSSRRGETFQSANTPSPNELALNLGPYESTLSVNNATLIRALDFPSTADDTEGFTALRLALADGRTRPLVHASQDTLTYLSEDGIFMDNITHDQAHPDIWRRFAIGERGPAIAAVGGVHDQKHLETVGVRLKKDEEFREAGHNLIREFDYVLQAHEATLSDSDLVQLGQTRTAKAFMLLGRALGVFS